MANEMEIPLMETIQQLRNELAVAVYEGKDQPLRFHVESVELELQVKVSRESTGKVGGKTEVKFWVVNAAAEAGGEHKRGSERVHTVKLKLLPIQTDPQGSQKQVLVGDRVDRLPK